jgi:hypothetical protein
MTTPLDIPLDALVKVASEAAANADAEAREAGLRPAGLLKRLRLRIAADKSVPGKIVRHVFRGRLKFRGRQVSPLRASARRKLGT